MNKSPNIHKFTSNNNQNKRELTYKILVIGDIGTGKTSIIKRYVHNIYSSNYKSTIGVDFAIKVVHWDDDTTIKLQLWDIAGQERFGHMTRSYYKEAVGALIVFDVSRRSTFDAVKKWKMDLDGKITLFNSDEPLSVVLLANKIDLITSTDQSEIDSLDLDNFCKNNGFVTHFNTSAKENFNIEEAINALVISITDKIKSNPNSPENLRDTVDLNDQNTDNDPVDKKQFIDNKCC